jgi:general secretion pathway protein G
MASEVKPCGRVRHGSSAGARGRGFTLLELLVVIAIIGLLAAYVGPRYFAQLGKSETTTAKAQVDAFSKALDAYRIDTGRYPTTEQGLNALLLAPAGVTRWNGPYLSKAVPTDPWGRAYLYRAPGSDGRDYEVGSYGKDGVPGGSGDDADVSN